LAALLGADSPRESLLNQTAKSHTDSGGEQKIITSPFTLEAVGGKNRSILTCSPLWSPTRINLNHSNRIKELDPRIRE